MTEACPDCLRPIALSYEAWMAHKDADDEHLSCLAHVAYSDDDWCGDEAIPDCRMATIVHLRADLAKAQRGLAAWEAVSAWLTISGEWHEVEWPIDLSEGEESPRYSCRAHASGNHAYGEGPTATAAIVALAQELKLGLPGAAEKSGNQ